MIYAERQQIAIDLETVFDALQQPLAMVEDPERRNEMKRFLETARKHQEKAIFDLLSDVAGMVNEASGDTRLRLEYQSRRFQLIVEPHTGSQAETESLASMEGELEKVTIRMPAGLKERIDVAAKAWGVSVNSWYVRTLARSVFHEMRRGAIGEPPIWRGRRGRRGGGHHGLPEDPA